MKFQPHSILNIFYITGFTLALIGPIKYEDIYSPWLVAFFVSFIILFSMGFSLGSSGITVKARQPSTAPQIPRLYTLILLVSLTYSLVLFAGALTKGGFSAISLEAGALNYAESYTGYERNSGNYSTAWIISEFMYPIHFATMAWSIFFFFKLGLMRRALAFLAIVLIVLNFGIIAGKMKIIGDTIIISFFVILTLMYGRRLGFLRTSGILAALLLGVMTIILVISNRYGLLEIDIDNINEKALDLQVYNEDSILITIFGPAIGFSIMQLTVYLTNGYYGLSLALRLPFEWTGFIGNSYSMMVIFDRFLGGDFLLEYTYPFRVGEEFGWALNKWHTAFAWFASDFTFPGTLVFFGFASFVYGRTWRAVVRDNNAYAVPIFAYLSLGFIFIPANNQLLISPGGILTLGLFFLIWLWPRASNHLAIT